MNRLGLFLKGVRMFCDRVLYFFPALVRSISSLRGAPGMRVEYQYSRLLRTVLLLAVLPSGLNASSYVAQGTLTRIVYNTKSGLPDEEKSCVFTVAVSNASWQIKTTFDKDFWTDFGCDGKDVFSILHDPDQKPQAGRFFNRPASVTPGKYPSIADPFTATIWLALASGDYTSSVGANLLPVPWTAPLNDPTACIFSSNGNYAEGTHLPLELTFTVSDRQLKTAPTNSLLIGNLEEHKLEWLKGFPPGFVGGHYKVAKLAESGLPTEFQLLRYAAPGGQVFERYTAVVKKIEFASGNVGAPDIDEAIGISDFRFSDTKIGLSCINYLVTNRTWMSEDDGGLKRLYANKKAHWEPYNPPHKPENAFTLRIILAGVMLAPILFWAVKSRTKPKLKERS